MKRPPDRPRPLPSHRRWRFGRIAAAVALITALTASITALALASGGSPTVSSASSKLGRVVVNGQGRTLYALGPETTRHLLCKSKACFEFWPPLTVSSGKAKLTAGGGVHGRLRILHRDGIFQVTLNGMPLYRYSGDSRKAEVNGEHIHSFGGIWHVISASAHGKDSAPARSGTQTSATSTSSSTSYSTATPSYSTTSSSVTTSSSTSTSSTAGGYGW
jgi:predicted lipoprotein with Yx(FWY)xxD motif